MDNFTKFLDIKKDKNSKGSIYFKIGVLIAIFIFIVVNCINSKPLSTNIPLLSIFFAGEAGDTICKYSTTKKISDLLSGISGIVYVIAAIILSLN